MKNIIAALWRGELHPEMRSGMDNAKLRQAEKELENCREEMEAVLSEEQERVFLNYLSALHRYMNESDEQIFHDGFSLAMKLTAEALLGAEKR